MRVCAGIREPNAEGAEITQKSQKIPKTNTKAQRAQSKDRECLLLLVWFDWVAVHLIPLPWRGGRRSLTGWFYPLAQASFAPPPPPPPACGVPLHGRGIRNGGVCKKAAKRKALNLQHKPKPKPIFGIFLRPLRNLCVLCVRPRIPLRPLRSCPRIQAKPKNSPPLEGWQA